MYVSFAMKNMKCVVAVLKIKRILQNIISLTYNNYPNSVIYMLFIFRKIFYLILCHSIILTLFKIDIAAHKKAKVILIKPSRNKNPFSSCILFKSYY